MKTLRTPLLLFALPAILIAFAPARHDLLLLDRTALEAGGIWRLWSGHWVHFSGSHLLWNLGVLLAAGAGLEHARPGLLWRHSLVAPPLIGLAVMAGETGLQTYGGLSGLATGVVVLLALHQLRAPGAPRWLWAGGLALVAIKVTGDLTGTDAWFARYGETGIRSSSVAHAAGALVAVLHYGAGRLPGRWQPAPENDAAGTRDEFPAARFR